MGRKPDRALGLRGADDLVEDPDPRAVADLVRMHGELEEPALLRGEIEFAQEDVEHHRRAAMRAQGREAVHAEIDSIVADPFDGDLDDTRGLTAIEQFIGFVIGHQRGIVEQADFANDLQRPGLKSQEAVRIPNGRLPASFVSTSLARSARSRSVS